ncbi:hypothetical protein [Candidatus Mycoplasma haematohominis]|uniref:hypothetical protein n=1 Tax=Candidatus Mycoplasma haematohominis TaxID=1494318 RepID=UPI001C0A6A0D|nr:hypothetical protein [Candidatus Mycoplasma haemohominis]
MKLTDLTAKKLVAAATGTIVVSTVVPVAVIALSNKEPPSYTLSSSESGNNYSGNQLGASVQNQSQLVADTEKNKDWFEWVYKNKLEPKKINNKGKNITSVFKDVTSGYGDNTTQHLNKVCESHYKKPKNEFSGANASTSHELKKDVENFCTVGGIGSLDVTAN